MSVFSKIQLLNVYLSCCLSLVQYVCVERMNSLVLEIIWEKNVLSEKRGGLLRTPLSKGWTEKKKEDCKEAIC